MLKKHFMIANTLTNCFIEYLFKLCLSQKLTLSSFIILKKIPLSEMTTKQYKVEKPNLHLYVYGFSADTNEDDIKSFIENQIKQAGITDCSGIKVKQSNNTVYSELTLDYVESIARLKKLYKYTSFRGLPVHFSEEFDFSPNKMIFIDDVEENSYIEIEKALREDFDIVFVHSIIPTTNGKFKATVCMESEDEAERSSLLITEINGRPVTVRKATPEEFTQDQKKLGMYVNKLSFQPFNLAKETITQILLQAQKITNVYDICESKQFPLEEIPPILPKFDLFKRKQ